MEGEADDRPRTVLSTPERDAMTLAWAGHQHSIRYDCIIIIIIITTACINTRRHIRRVVSSQVWLCYRL